MTGINKIQTTIKLNRHITFGKMLSLQFNCFDTYFI